MKVLIISSKYPPEYAGSAWRAHNTYKRLRAKFGIEYDVICNSIEHNNNTTYKYDDVCVRRLCREWGQVKGNRVISKIINHFIYLVNFIYIGFLTWRILKAGNYDMIHTFGSSISVNVGMQYARFSNKALLREICNHGTYPWPVLPLKLGKVFKYRFWPKSMVVAISKRVADLCRREGVEEMYLWERPNPVDEEKFKPSRGKKYDLRKKLTKFADDDKVLVDVSKFMPRKNKKFLVEVMKHLEEEYKLLIFGPIISSGPLFERDKRCYDEIIKSIKENKLDDRIQVVTGFYENIEEFFQLADVFVFPTLADGLGTPMLESIACGIPVVANNIEGITDCWIELDRTGYYCELEPQKFADCIVKACHIKPEILQQGSEDILSKASTEIIDQQYFEHIKNLVSYN